MLTFTKLATYSASVVGFGSFRGINNKYRLDLEYAPRWNVTAGGALRHFTGTEFGTRYSKKS